MSDQKTLHRRWQISLRAFLVVLTLACVWFGWQVNRSNRQRKAVAWVLQMGGRVMYDSQHDDEGRRLAVEPTGPKWLRNVYDQVVYVNLSHTPALDLTPLANLKNLERLHASNTQVSDLTPLANLTDLRTLSLANTQISDPGPLENLTSLRSLFLEFTPVSDLTPLANLTDLRTLSLFNTQASDLDPLGKLTSLGWLSLTNTQISDLSPLENLTSLRSLFLENTTVREEQITILQQALPNCAIKE